MKTIPANDFAIVLDTERNLVTHAGNTSECFNQRDWSNHAYQSTAYVVSHSRWSDPVNLELLKTGLASAALLTAILAAGTILNLPA